MGHQSLSPAWLREVTPVELRSLAETVWRLVHRDSGQVALHMISRALRDAGDRSPGERRAYLLNLRGIVYAQQNKPIEALADLGASAEAMPGWHIPLYNLALCHKQARRWPEAAAALQRALSGMRGKGREPGRALLWNLGIAQTAMGAWDEARATWRACGLNVAGGDLDLGLGQLSLPTSGPYAAERVWVQRIDPARARILSVVRFGAPCQFGDVVLCDEGSGHTGFYDGVVARDGEGEGEGRRAGRDGSMVFLDVLERAGYTLYVIDGAAATAAQATTLTERLREAELHIEAWSLTMRLPDVAQPEGGAAVPFCGGLVLPTAQGDGQIIAERAVDELQAAEREVGLQLYYPALMLAAGNELGAARHRKALRSYR